MEEKEHIRGDGVVPLMQLIKRLKAVLLLFIVRNLLFSNLSLFSIFGLILFLVAAFIIMHPLINLI